MPPGSAIALAGGTTAYALAHHLLDVPDLTVVTNSVRVADVFQSGQRRPGANHAEATFWYVLPSLPMFLALPLMLRNGVGFWWALFASCVLTIVLYFVAVVVAARFGVRI